MFNFIKKYDWWKKLNEKTNWIAAKSSINLGQPLMLFTNDYNNKLNVYEEQMVKCEICDIDKHIYL